MKQKFQLILFLLMLHISVSAQQYGVIVKDKKAIAKSNKKMAFNIFKQQDYNEILEFSEDIQDNYLNIEALQRKVLNNSKQTEAVSELRWADLSKSIYLANELVNGTVQPGLEIDMVVEHPVFQENPDEIYRALFIAGSADVLAFDLNSFKQAKQKAQSLSTSFQRFASERKAYAAVAFIYLSEDLVLKAVEMNEVLKQPMRLPAGRQGFSMTEAERMRLKVYSEEYLQFASEMLEKSDKLLLEIAYCRPLQSRIGHEQKRLERATIANTTVLDY